MNLQETKLAGIGQSNGKTKILVSKHKSLDQEFAALLAEEVT